MLNATQWVLHVVFCERNPGKWVKLYSELWMLNLLEIVEPVWHYRGAGLWSTLKSAYLWVLSFASCIPLKETKPPNATAGALRVGQGQWPSHPRGAPAAPGGGCAGRGAVWAGDGRRRGRGEKSHIQTRWSQQSRDALNGQSGWTASGKASPTTIGELFSVWMERTLAVFSWVAVLRTGAWFSLAADTGILFAVKF